MPPLWQDLRYGTRMLRKQLSFTLIVVLALTHWRTRVFLPSSLRALGTQSGNIIAMVMRQGLSLTLSGLTPGLAGAAILSRLLERPLHGVSATDAPTFVAIALLLLSVAALACWIPARRATKVDPADRPET